MPPNAPFTPPVCTAVNFELRPSSPPACDRVDFDLCGSHAGGLVAAELSAPHRGELEPLASELSALHAQAVPVAAELEGPHRSTTQAASELTAPHLQAWRGTELSGPHQGTRWSGSELEARHSNAWVAVELSDKHQSSRWFGVEFVALHKSAWRGSELGAPHQQTRWPGSELVAPVTNAWRGSELWSQHRDASHRATELETLHRGWWTIGDELTALHEQMGWEMIRTELRAPHSQTHQTASQVAAPHRAAWQTGHELSGPHSQTVPAALDLTAPHRGLAPAAMELGGPHRSFDARPVACELVAPHQSSDRVVACSELGGPHRSAEQVVTDGLSVTVAGIVLDPVRVAITESRQQAVIEVELEIADKATWERIHQGQPATVELWGYAWRLIVDGATRNETWAETTYVVRLASQAARLDFPRADAVEGELAGLASELARRLAGSIPLHWDCVDWRIGPGRWMAAGESPLALLQTLATTCGAVLLSDRDGSLRVQPRYAVSVPDWPAAAPALHLATDAAVIAIDVSGVQRDGIDSITVTDEGAGSDELRLVEDRDRHGAGVTEVLVYQVPWTDDFTLTHRGEVATAGIVDLGVEERLVTEEEIIVQSGEGRAQYPVYAVVAARYNARNLGTVTYSEDGALSTAVKDESILILSYRTRCRRYRVREDLCRDLLVVASNE